MAFLGKQEKIERTSYSIKQKNKTRLIILAVFIFFVLAGSLDYPIIWDKSVNWINSQFGFNLPNFHKTPFKLGLDLQGGTHLIYEANLLGIDSSERSTSLESIRDVIERRVNLFGVAESVVQINKSGDSHRLIVDLPGVKDIHEAIKMIGETPYLEFREEKTQEEIDAMLGKNKQEDLTVHDYFKNTPLTGRYLKRADLAFDQTTNKPHIALEFNDEGAKIFAEITKRNVSKKIAIYLDGKAIVDTNGDTKIDDNDLYAPTVQEEISGGKAQITGEQSVDFMKSIVMRLNSGALPVPITLISQQNIEASLGYNSLNQSLKAGFIGFLAILLFLIVFYRLSGFFASVSLIIYIVFLLAVFKLVPVTLTLAGIAGFLLSMGMAVDANILIFSRVKEEIKTGRDFLSALENGVKRAWPSIRDGNFTTILVGVVLFIFGTGFIKGFALTLILGNLISMFSAIVITNYLIRFFFGAKTEKVKKIWL